MQFPRNQILGFENFKSQNPKNALSWAQGALNQSYECFLKLKTYNVVILLGGPGFPLSLARTVRSRARTVPKHSQRS